MQAPTTPSETQLFRSRRALALGIGVALAVLAGTIVWSALGLRQHIRAQIASRDGETLDAVAAMQYLDDKTSGDTIAPLADPGEQIQLAIKISRLRNVLGVRLFSAEGKFVNAFPAYITEATLPDKDLAALHALKPVSHFVARARLEEHDLLAETNSAPVALLEVNIPLHEEGEARLAGAAQFLMDGTSIAREYAALDRHLALRFGLAFVAGSGILAAGLALAFRRVQRSNRLLAERTSSLLQANRELALAAKTSAVGAVTSHLIHGLRNPLTGLRSFVRDRAVAPGNGADSDWQLAVATTDRMQNLINRVVRVLQEEPAAASYELSLVELVEMLSHKLAPAASAANVRFETGAAPPGTLSNQEADLVLLILENLVQNAIDATPAGKTVRLAVRAEGKGVVMEVEDEGPGLAPEVEARLFTPCTSRKEGGSGIGLAISQQLAKHLGAELCLKCSSPKGCTFRLALPQLGCRVKSSVEAIASNEQEPGADAKSVAK
jgi:signal transduction histidine kinase